MRDLRGGVVGLSCAMMTSLGAPPVASAQSAYPLSLQASAYALAFPDFATSGLGASAGWELQVRYSPSRWSIGVGYESTRESDGIGFDGGSGPSGTFYEHVASVETSGFMLEPRYVFAVMWGRLAIYGSTRFAILNQQIRSQISRPVEPEDVPEVYEGRPEAAFCFEDRLIFTGQARCFAPHSSDESIYVANLGGGLMLNASDRINLESGISLGRAFGTNGFDQTLTMRLGVTVGL